MADAEFLALVDAYREKVAAHLRRLRLLPPYQCHGERIEEERARAALLAYHESLEAERARLEAERVTMLRLAYVACYSTSASLFAENVEALRAHLRDLEKQGIAWPDFARRRAGRGNG